MKYQIMFYSGIVGSVIMLILTIVIFIKGEIAQAISDLTGINFNLNINSKQRQVKRENTGRIKAKEIAQSTELINEITDKLTLEKTNLLDNGDTDIINTGDTELISEVAEETSLLREDEDETTILEEGLDETPKHNKIDFIKELDIIVVNCDIAL